MLHSSVATAAKGGRAIGAMFFSIFGGAWLALWGYNEFAPPYLALSVVALATVALFAWSRIIYQANAEALRNDGQTPEAKRRSRLFNLINGGQWIVIFLLATILIVLHRQDLILPAIILVIGLHFFPLAKLFSYWPHYVTGAALVVLALAYPMLSAEGPKSAAGALGTGIVLWLSAIWALLPNATSTSEAR